MKGIRVSKIIKEIKFEGVLGELESKNGFQRQIFESNSSFHAK